MRRSLHRTAELLMALLLTSCTNSSRVINLTDSSGSTPPPGSDAVVLKDSAPQDRLDAGETPPPVDAQRHLDTRLTPPPPSDAQLPPPLGDALPPPLGDALPPPPDALPPPPDALPPPPVDQGGPLADLGSGPLSVSGGIIQNTVWTKANSPVSITGDTYIFPGVTLTINEGVTVHTAANAGLYVKGTLNVNGTEAEPVLFTTDSPALDKWGGIHIKNLDGGKASINWIIVEYADTGFDVECCHDGGPLEIRDSIFRYNTTALGGYAGWSILVERCLFHDNVRAANAADKDIFDSVIRDNQFGFDQVERTRVYRTLIQDNEVGLSGQGNSLEECRVTGNDVGVDSIWASSNTLVRNTVVNNKVGVRLGGYSGQVSGFHDNNLCNNSDFSLTLEASSTDVTGNYWCSTVEQDIASNILDAYDEPQRGIATFVPFLNAPVPGAPPL